MLDEYREWLLLSRFPDAAQHEMMRC